jgi:hypothetical protein
MRLAMINGASNTPQFWMGDYLAVVDASAKRQGISRNDEGFGERECPICASRYTTETDDKSEAAKMLTDLQITLKAAYNGKFVSAAVFRGLQGRWSITRQLESSLPSFPTGTFAGTASFHPRYPTSRDYTSEYLYVEEGELKTDAGLNIPANKRYAYRYSAESDQVSVWFVKPDGKTIDYFFHDISLLPKEADAYSSGWKAKGTHLCEKDNYDSAYEFRFTGATLQALTIKFIVKGPNKDYVSTTQFSRPKHA